jgi:predicted esterase
MKSKLLHSIGAVYFSHGKESGPWGDKIKRLAQVVEAKGFVVNSIDYSGIADPDLRVQKLLASYASEPGCLILVGSSMGGYVATVASETLKPQGLFLMAPALYLPGFLNQDPVPRAGLTAIVHGWKDELIPVEHSIRFAKKYGAQLHLIDGDHRLINQIPFIASVFSSFLDKVSLGEYP